MWLDSNGDENAVEHISTVSASTSDTNDVTSIDHREPSASMVRAKNFNCQGLMWIYPLESLLSNYPFMRHVTTDKKGLLPYDIVGFEVRQASIHMVVCTNSDVVAVCSLLLASSCAPTSATKCSSRRKASRATHVRHAIP